ncbi:PAS domain-containing protein [Pseudomonas asuensis]
MSDNGSSSIPALSRQALTELVFDHTADYAVIVTDPLGKIIAWNPSAEVILGWTAEEAVGQPYELFYTPDDRAAGQPIKEIEAALEQGRALDERWHIKRDGTIFWASGELSPLYKDGVLIGYTKILRDRTRERLTEESLRLAQKVGNIGTFELSTRGLDCRFSRVLSSMGGSHPEQIAGSDPYGAYSSRGPSQAGY